jgi:hypothetical protein
MARVDERPLFEPDDISRIEALSCHYVYFKPSGPSPIVDIPPNPAPHAFRVWCQDSPGFVAGITGDEPNLKEIPITPSGFDDTDEWRMHHAASLLRGEPLEPNRQFLAIIEIMSKAKVWSTGSAAVCHFISHVISGVLPFRESPSRDSHRRSITKCVEKVTRFLSVASDVDQGWIDQFTEINDTLGRRDNKCFTSTAAAELAIRKATYGGTGASRTNADEYEEGSAAFEIGDHVIPSYDYFAPPKLGKEAPPIYKYRVLCFLVYSWRDAKHSMIFDRHNAEMLHSRLSTLAICRAIATVHRGSGNRGKPHLDITEATEAILLRVADTGGR